MQPWTSRFTVPPAVLVSGVGIAMVGVPHPVGASGGGGAVGLQVSVGGLAVASNVQVQTPEGSSI